MRIKDIFYEGDNTETKDAYCDQEYQVFEAQSKAEPECIQPGRKLERDRAEK